MQINPSLQPIAERLGLKRMVPVAVDRAVADIITPVVERSVTIACMTTQELILKVCEHSATCHTLDCLCSIFLVRCPQRKERHKVLNYVVVQDFAMEADEGRMRKAAHLMVSSLAGSLALVTCREPLRSSLATQLRHLLTNTMEASQLEHTVQVTAREASFSASITARAVPLCRVRSLLSSWAVSHWTEAYLWSVH